MPEWTYDDRMVLDLESRLWAARQLLVDIPECFWTKEVTEIRRQIERLARELREHNDGFEVEC